MPYQWYPGHMTKAKRMMQEQMKLIDLVIELVDARVPMSSKNPDIDQLAQNKSRLILMNKADLADPVQSDRWIAYFRERGIAALTLDSRNNKGMQAIHQTIQEVCREKTERDRKRGILNRPIRAMVAGIPNVGKSTFINSFAGRACTKTGNKPGVTKGKQWIRLNKNVELLDTPWILWPKFDDQAVGERLAFIGSLNDEIVNREELALNLLSFLHRAYAGMVEKYYSLEAAEPGDCFDAVNMLSQIAQTRGCLLPGHTLDLFKASCLLLDDFRSGKLGRITLEFAPQSEQHLEADGVTEESI